MTVYVDNAHIRASVPHGANTITSTWCHMTADTHDELLAFAVSIGLRVSWLQRVGRPGEHFDVTARRRAAAIKNGAVEITWREGVEQMKCQAQGKAFDLGALRS